MNLSKRFLGNVPWIVSLLLALGVLLAGCASEESGYLKVGDSAPDFSLPTVSGDTYVLADDLGQQPVLLYFSMAEG
ncbi:MAG: hypothetical protein JXB38_06860 [Anaerolineales bacterium]|nr:hypothetical protein [Anaerolineales bacterium]